MQKIAKMLPELCENGEEREHWKNADQPDEPGTEAAQHNDQRS